MRGTRAQARGDCRTRYLDEVPLEQGAVHAAGNLPGQLQRAVPAADPPASPQAEAARRRRDTRTAQREQQQQQTEAHAGAPTVQSPPPQGAAEATVHSGASSPGPGPAPGSWPRPPGQLSCGDAEREC